MRSRALGPGDGPATNHRDVSPWSSADAASGMWCNAAGEAP